MAMLLKSTIYGERMWFTTITCDYHMMLSYAKFTFLWLKFNLLLSATVSFSRDDPVIFPQISLLSKDNLTSVTSWGSLYIHPIASHPDASLIVVWYRMLMLYVECFMWYLFTLK